MLIHRTTRCQSMTATETNTAEAIEVLFLKTIKSIAKSDHQGHHKQLLINTAWSLKKIAESDDVKKTTLSDTERNELKAVMPASGIEEVLAVVE